MTTLADPDDFSVSAHSPLESVLCLEAGPGAIWQVWGTRSAIGSLRDFVRHCPGVGSPHRLQAIRGEPAHETDATASALVDLPIGLQTQGTCWQFSLRMPVLSATQLNGLHTGCLLLAEVSTQAQTLCLPVVAMAGQTPPDCALRACAALTLCLTAGQHHDTFELRWDTFMPAFSDKPMGERQRISSMSAVSATESISTQLMCVIGSRHMLLSELLQLQAGDLLTLQDFPLPHVLLLLGDKKIGTGELVRCGQTLAVQIVEWMADPVYASEQSSGPARASSHDGDVCPVQADAVSPSHPERDSAS
jgi:flagellar motor switch/type III secretory pathway protein FliN